MTQNPETPNGVLPYLTVPDAEAAIQYYTEVFGAKELYRMPHEESGRLMHVTLAINGCQIYLADDFPDWREGVANTPEHFGGSPVTLHMKVADVDALVAKAVEKGAVVTVPVADMFWGDRFGKIKDPFGHEWSLATTIAAEATKESAPNA